MTNNNLKPYITAVLFSFLFVSIVSAQNKAKTRDIKINKDYAKGLEYFQKYESELKNYEMLEKSVECFTKAAKKEKYNVNIYYVRGQAQFYLEKYNAANADFDLALKLSPEECLIYEWKGDTDRNLEKWDAALKNYEKALDLGCEKVYTLWDIAATYTRAKNYKSAIYYYSKAIAVDSTIEELYDSRESLYLIMKEYELALKDVNKIISLNPVYSSAYNDRGLIYNGLKRYEEAIKDYEKSLQLKPKNFYENDHVEYVWNNMGNSYFAMGNKEKACECWQNAVNIGYIYKPEWKEQYLIDSPHDLLKWHCQ